MSLYVVTLQNLLAILDEIAPFSNAEDWDNVGLMVGDLNQEVKGVLVGLDPTMQVLDEALDIGANLIVTHHPVIFKPLSSLRVDQPIGAFLAKAIANKIAVVGCHTNLDVVEEGVSVVLGRKLGLQCQGPLARTKAAGDAQTGFGQVGQLTTPLSFEQFVKRLCETLDLAAVRWAGTLPAQVEKVAVCGGSGSDLAELAFESGAHVYVTGEVKHSVARWAEEVGFCIIDAGHYATENLMVNSLVAMLDREIASRGFEISVQGTAKQQNPFNFYFVCEKEAAKI